MAEVANDSVNPDISLLRDINDLAKRAPLGLDRMVAFIGEYGLVALALLLAVLCWWRVARRAEDAPAAVAGVLWSVLAAGASLLLNLPVRALVQRPRPAVDHDGLDILIRSGHGYSFVSDHAALTAAIAVGLFMVSRSFGTMALVVAVCEGFTRVFLGVQYPTDVIGGFALGAATVLLLAPLGLALLTRLTTVLSRSRASFLVSASPRPTSPHLGPAPSPHLHHTTTDKDLAA